VDTEDFLHLADTADIPVHHDCQRCENKKRLMTRLNFDIAQNKTNCLLRRRPRMLRGASKGFTLTELLIAMAVLATIMVMITPMVVSRLGTKKLQSQATQVMSDVSKAYGLYIRQNGMVVPGTTRAADMMRFMNYVRTVRGETTCTNDGDQCIQVLTGAAENEVTSVPCSNEHPCLLLQNGGYLQYGRDAIFPTGNNTQLSAIVLNFDPDGPGIQPATTFYLYENARLTTAPWALPANTVVQATPQSPTSAPANVQFSDPEYLWGFTYETTPTN
jgi:prepilin-type N-terminal cleavage/methylation domain-containing protein